MSNKEKPSSASEFRRQSVDLDQTQPVEIGLEQTLAGLKWRWQHYQLIIPASDYQAFLLRLPELEAQVEKQKKIGVSNEQLESTLYSEHQHIERLVGTIRQNHRAATERRNQVPLSERTGLENYPVETNEIVAAEKDENWVTATLNRISPEVGATTAEGAAPVKSLANSARSWSDLDGNFSDHSLWGRYRSEDGDLGRNDDDYGL